MLAPVSRDGAKSSRNNQIEYHSEDTIEQVYSLYKECIRNFGPNLNSSQVLLYVYKLFFNIKYHNFTTEYSQWTTKTLVNVVMRFISDQLIAYSDGEGAEMMRGGTGPHDTVKTKTEEQSSFNMSSIEKESRNKPRQNNFRFKSIKDEQVIRLSLDRKQ